MANALGKHRFVVDSEGQGMRETWRVSLALPFYGGGDLQGAGSVPEVTAGAAEEGVGD